MVTRNSEGPGGRGGRGVLTAKFIKKKYKAKLEIPGWREGGGGTNQIAILSGGIDIF